MSALPRPATSCRDLISIEDFENGVIDVEQFDHEAHVFVAWSYLQRYDLTESIGRFCDALKRLTKKLGIESKYHETISWFFLICISERAAMQGPSDWQSFRRQNPDLFATQPSIIRAYYSAERLGSATARSRFVLPDQLPLS